MQAVTENKLIFRSDLHIVARLTLAVSHNKRDVDFEEAMK